MPEAQDLRSIIKRAQDEVKANLDVLRRSDLGELLARRHTRACLAGIMRIAEDESIAAGIRIEAYTRVWQMAYGKPASVIRVPDASVSPTLDADIEQAQAASAALGELEAWASKPPSEWPAHLRQLVGAEILDSTAEETPPAPAG